MPTSHRFRTLFVLVATLLAVPVAFAHGDEGPAGPVRQLIGRSHVLLVHFPIALLIAAAAIEACVSACGLFRRHEVDDDRETSSSRPSHAATVCLLLGTAGAFAAAWAGWTNADVERYGAALHAPIETHRWAGVTVVGLSVAASSLLGLARSTRSSKLLRMYRATLLLCAVAVGVAGHLGGSLVHGDDYITGVLFGSEPSEVPDTPAPMDTPEAAPEEESPASDPVDFRTQILPIFEAHCIECHRAGRSKGGLRLDTPDHAFVAYQEYAIIVPGDPIASELHARIILQEGDRALMPRLGPRLPDDQIELIRRWIEEGARWPEDSGAAPGKQR